MPQAIVPSTGRTVLGVNGWEVDEPDVVDLLVEDFSPAFTVSRILSSTRGQSRNNCTAYIQNNLATYNGVQYAVYWAAGDGVKIASRLFPDPTYLQVVWTIVDLTSLLATTSNDEHNVCTVFVTPDGFIWVAQIRHNSALGSRLLYSDIPESIGTTAADWTVGAMTGLNETQMTYLNAFMVNGAQYVTYRDGISGNGDWYLNKYTPNVNPALIGTWARVSKLFNGKTDSPVNSFYPNRWCVDRAGRFHAGGVFRDVGGVNNINVGYMFSDDMLTWYKSNGAQITLPATIAKIETAVTVAATTSNQFLNSGGLDVSPNGDVHLALAKSRTAVDYTEDIWYVTRRKGTWSSQFITNAGTPYGMGRPQVVTTDGGRVLILSSSRLLWGDALVCWDVTDKANVVGPFPITKLTYYNGEMCFDSEALRSSNRLDFMVVQECITDTVTPLTWGTDHYVNANWNRQCPVVVSLDLSQIAEVASGKVGLPRIDVVRSNTVIAPTAITSASNVAVAGAFFPISDLVTKYAEGSLWYRWTVTAAQTVAGIGTVVIQEYIDDSSTNTLNDALAFTVAQASGVEQTPWQPVLTITYGLTGHLGLDARASGGGTLTITSAVLEVGVLRCN